ncbi:hypothetical protein JCM33374_g4188 [Metschnikowia sp. JCM 33374]|nr:hypothetical protein JCM33374_g4188 [Metschnikowia sp. JCM 33374]
MAMADAFTALQANMASLAATHKAVNGFNESFASFLYGLMITMFCNNFPGCPTRKQHEVMEEKRASEERIAVLQEKLEAARLKNAQLKEQVAQRVSETRQKSHPGDIFSSRPTTRQRIPPPKTVLAVTGRRKIPVARDDSFSTTDTFIEAPGTTLMTNASSRTGTASASATPNLDQAPRYMRGLFEVPGASNIRRGGGQRSNTKAEGKLGMRAPPRTPAGRITASQRALGYSPGLSARNAASSAAQRAQKARANRLASRPPFR